jgi:excisionase family DNA binding protein
MRDVKPGQALGVMTLDQVAKLTGRNVSLLARWARAGRIPATKIGNVWLVAESDLAIIDAMPRTPGRKPKGDPC